VRLALALLISIPVVAQTPATKLPNAAGCGASFSDPGWTGYCYFATPMVSSQAIYSFSLYQFIPNGKSVPTESTTTGAALDVRQFAFKAGTLHIFLLGTLGVGTSATAVTLATSGGGLVLWRSAKGWTISAGGIENKASGVTRPQWVLGPGLTW